MYRTVEPLTPDESVRVVEDVDGIRVLVTPETTISVSHWQRAYDAGVALIHIPEHGSVSTDDFIATRRESRATMTYEVTTTFDLGPEPSYRDYVAGEIAAEDADPLDGTRFVHLHTHTEYSTLDGLSTMEEAFTQIVADGHGALGSADHGTCAGHPEQQALADQHGVKAIFGMEAYFVPDRFRRSRQWVELDGVEVNPEHLTEAEKKKTTKASDAKDALGEYTHVTLWAEDQQGLRNLWAMSTEAYRDGLYDGKARLDWDTLTRLHEGVLCGTGCLRGPVTRPLITCACGHEGSNHLGSCRHVDTKTEVACGCESFRPRVEEARENLMRLHQIFGDRLYIEIHTNHLADQIEANKVLMQWSRDYGIPAIAAVDSHYSVPEHQIVHQTWVAMQTGKTLAEETSMFQGGQDYHLKTADEVATALDYLPGDFVEESMANTVALARRCTARVEGKTTTPTYSNVSKEHPDPVARDVERLIDLCMANWARKISVKGPAHDEACLARLERELALIIAKQFCGYFLIVWDYVGWAKREGCLVGPGRGSGGGSLVAYLLDITEIDPVETDLLFERFLTEGRTSLPDFDIDFPTSWRPRIRAYVAERWGEEYVANIGTVLRLRSKQAINDVVRVMEPILPYEIDHKAVSLLKKLVDAADAPLAGKHLPWDEFCAQYADIVDPIRESMPEVFAMVDVVVDRVKTYGKHAAGIVISTDSPLTDLPMRMVEDKTTKTTMMVTQFDMNALELLGYVKFDVLTLRTLDTIQAAVDLIEAKYGRKIRPYDWIEEYRDPQVWDEVAAGKTLGLFQIETAAGTRLTKRMKPANLADLAAVMTVVRPGPMRSGLTESYLLRREGLEAVTYLDPRLESFLGDTYGSMIYQEQVMATCMNLAGYDSNEADAVRKLLGKKLVEKVVAAGQEFTARAAECNTDPLVAETLWAQMAEFAKYGFNKAHAYAYAVLGYWCSWIKFHFPVEFLTAALSTVDADRLPDFIEECRRMGYAVLPPDVNRSGITFAAHGMEVIYGLANIKGIGEATAATIVTHAPYTDLDDFVERAVNPTGSAVNMGHLSTLVAVGALDSIIVNRRATEIQLAAESSGEARRCAFKDTTRSPAPVLVQIGTGEDAAEHPVHGQCDFDWETEPDPPTVMKGRGKAKRHVPKPPPKGCSIKCRQYTPPPPIDPASVAPYTEDDLMDREKELLGVWLTRTPFDRVPEEFLDASQTASEIEHAPVGNRYMGICLVDSIKTKRDRTGKEYAFVGFNLQDGVVEAICFASLWEQRKRYLTKDSLGVVMVNKTDRGFNVYDYNPMP